MQFKKKLTPLKFFMQNSRNSSKIQHRVTTNLQSKLSVSPLTIRPIQPSLATKLYPKFHDNKSRTFRLSLTMDGH